MPVCSTTGSLEAAYKQAFGKGISLSEQQLVDCARAFNNFGCNGGLPSQAFEYIKYNGGIETEEAYPYTAKDGECKFTSENVAVQVLESVNITLVRLVGQLFTISVMKLAFFGIHSLAILLLDIALFESQSLCFIDRLLD